MLAGFLWAGSPIVVALATFGAYAASGQPLRPNIAFTALALFNVPRLRRAPCIAPVQRPPTAAASWRLYDRITFLTDLIPVESQRPPPGQVLRLPMMAIPMGISQVRPAPRCSSPHCTGFPLPLPSFLFSFIA